MDGRYKGAHAYAFLHPSAGRVPQTAFSDSDEFGHCSRSLRLPPRCRSVGVGQAGKNPVATGESQGLLETTDMMTAICLRGQASSWVMGCRLGETICTEAKVEPALASGRMGPVQWLTRKTTLRRRSPVSRSLMGQMLAVQSR